MSIKFEKIKSVNRLFLDFINNFGNVKKYYNLNFKDKESYAEVFNKITNQTHFKKDELTAIIKNQYSSFPFSEKTSNNIKKLKEKNTIAVITGQQLGIMSGPLYTIYKILTAIKLSEQLSEEFTDFNFVPIFWMAGDDHDFEEISYVNIIDKNNKVKKFSYEDGKPVETNRGSVGNLKFKESIKNFKNELEENLRETEFNDELFELMNLALNDNLTIAESFIKIIFHIFDETGLVIFNPQDTEVKKLMLPIFKKELLQFRTHNNDLLEVSADLDENYHAQVKLKPINLFLSNKTGRHLIEPEEQGFRLKGKRKTISKEEILQHLETNPEDFSANVLLRPICEEYLFPTGFYISGPGEISYYAQVMPLYKHFDLQQPFIYPRASATILESNIAKAIDKYNLDNVDVLQNFDDLKSLLIKTISEDDLENKFNNINNQFTELLDSLNTTLSKVNKDLEGITDSAKEKILHQVNVLKNKTDKMYEQKYEISLRQIEKAHTVLYPNNNLQERELTFINFVNKYGFDFFDWLYQELEINNFEHQILEI
ncbi:MAG: bacillithiol biosynthesis cysteine-adding enzyme BshC [Ignavibacteriae bacterium]|nr:MAG: bacillithiol biosynthesis cysteine-adding enzyme BshC [Ignavibacteriota bacterium]